MKEQRSWAADELEKAKVDKAEIQRKASVLSGRLAQVTTSNLLDKQGHSTTKSVGEYSHPHLRRLKRKRRESCELSLTWLDRESYIATKVELLNTETGEKQSLCLNKERSNQLFGPDVDVAKKSPTFVKQGLLGLFWRDESNRAVFAKLLRHHKLCTSFTIFNFRKLSVTVKSIPCVCHTASIVPF